MKSRKCTALICSALLCAMIFCSCNNLPGGKEQRNDGALSRNASGEMSSSDVTEKPHKEDNFIIPDSTESSVNSEKSSVSSDVPEVQTSNVDEDGSFVSDQETNIVVEEDSSESLSSNQESSGDTGSSDVKKSPEPEGSGGITITPGGDSKSSVQDSSAKEEVDDFVPNPDGTIEDYLVIDKIVLRKDVIRSEAPKDVSCKISAISDNGLLIAYVPDSENFDTKENVWANYINSHTDMYFSLLDDMKTYMSYNNVVLYVNVYASSGELVLTKTFIR